MNHYKLPASNKDLHFDLAFRLWLTDLPSNCWRLRIVRIILRCSDSLCDAPLSPDPLRRARLRNITEGGGGNVRLLPPGMRPQVHTSSPRPRVGHPVEKVITRHFANSGRNSPFSTDYIVPITFHTWDFQEHIASTQNKRCYGWAEFRKCGRFVSVIQTCFTRAHSQTLNDGGTFNSLFWLKRSVVLFQCYLLTE